MSDTVNVTIAGLGGQGVLTASDILAEAAFRAGRDVKKAEVHGMSQRGGSVSSDVRFGDAVQSPMIPNGETAWMVVLDETQVEVVDYRLAPDGTLITPADIADAELPNAKCLNTAMLGALSAKLDIPDEAWTDALHACLAEKLHDMNDAAFAAGRAAVS